MDEKEIKCESCGEYMLDDEGYQYGYIAEGADLKKTSYEAYLKSFLIKHLECFTNEEYDQYERGFLIKMRIWTEEEWNEYKY